MHTLTITSPAFARGGWIPDCHSDYGENQSPELHIEGLSERAVTLAVTLDDMDHPLFPNYNHWVCWNLPPVNVLPEGLPQGALLELPLHMEQGVAYGKHKYRGPKPPFHWKHRYRFTVYALDTKLALDHSTDKRALLSSIQGHVLQSGELIGVYQRGHR